MIGVDVGEAVQPACRSRLTRLAAASLAYPRPCAERATTQATSAASTAPAVPTAPASPAVGPAVGPAADSVACKVPIASPVSRTRSTQFAQTCEPSSERRVASRRCVVPSPWPTEASRR